VDANVKEYVMDYELSVWTPNSGHTLIWAQQTNTPSQPCPDRARRRRCGKRHCMENKKPPQR